MILFADYLQRNPYCYITNKLVAVISFKDILVPLLKRSGNTYHVISIVLIRIKLNVSFDNTKVYIFNLAIKTQITWWLSDGQLIFLFLKSSEMSLFIPQ